MSADPTPSIDRLLDLLADRATDGLSAAEAEELARLQGKWPHLDDEEFDRTAAALALRGPAEPLPNRLRLSLQRDAGRFFAAPATTGTGWKIAATLGWLSTAACVAIAIWLIRPGPTAEARREQLLADATAITLPASDARGDVVWSRAKQVGVLTLKGLPTNDPTKEQYQLWIFDRNRDERYPVDGGVFDVRGGTAVVPVRAKLPVKDPTLFAVTVERPGGVVVSDRSRVVWTAK